jgi:hypothetical protein
MIIPLYRTSTSQFPGDIKTLQQLQLVKGRAAAHSVSHSYVAADWNRRAEAVSLYVRHAIRKRDRSRARDVDRYA